MPCRLLQFAFVSSIYQFYDLYETGVHKILVEPDIVFSGIFSTKVTEPAGAVKEATSLLASAIVMTDTEFAYMRINRPL
jgi:hypothetical protein